VFHSLTVALLKMNYLMNYLLKSVKVIFIVFFSIGNLCGQCLTADAEGDCSGCTAITSGGSVNTGETKCFTGGPTTFGSSISVNGGTLRICGDLTTALNTLNGGSPSKIIITSTGKLTITNNFDVNGNNVIITNYGTLKMNGNITLQGNTNHGLVNASPTAVLTILGTLLVQSNSHFVNQGQATIQELRMQGNPKVCLLNGSQISVNSLFNDASNPLIIATTGNKACLSLPGAITGNQPITNSSDVLLCVNGSTGDNVGANQYGSASVTLNCSNCTSVLPLPIELLYFKGREQSKKVWLEWQTLAEINHDYFTIERSSDAKNFVVIREKIQGTGNSHTPQKYAWIDEEPLNGLNYYRLKQTDFDGTFEYSAMIMVMTSQEQTPLQVYPNPTKDKIKIRLNTVQPQAKIMLKDAFGKTLQTLDTESLQDNLWQIDVSHYPQGIYFIKYLHFVQKVVKLN
jgi:hypothetical protein